jgi:hypothetical protein
MNKEEEIRNRLKESQERLRNMTPEERSEFEKRFRYFKERWDADRFDLNNVHVSNHDIRSNECPQCGESFEEDCDECLRCGYVRNLSGK